MLFPELSEWFGIGHALFLSHVPTQFTSYEMSDIMLLIVYSRCVYFILKAFLTATKYMEFQIQA